MEVTLGIPYPLHAGASSKAFLAFLDPAEIEAYLARHPLDAVTDKTVTDAAKLRKDLAAIRSAATPTSLGERQPGAASIAAPVFDHDGHVVAVISVAGPAARFRPDTPRFVTALLGAARRVSAQLGYLPPSGLTASPAGRPPTHGRRHPSPAGPPPDSRSGFGGREPVAEGDGERVDGGLPSHSSIGSCPTPVGSRDRVTR